MTKRLRDANDISIGDDHENLLLDTRIYEVEHMYGQKVALSANTIATNMFSQVDKEGNQYALLDAIVRTDGSEVIPDNVLFKSKIGVCSKQETTE